MDVLLIFAVAIVSVLVIIAITSVIISGTRYARDNRNKTKPGKDYLSRYVSGRRFSTETQGEMFGRFGEDLDFSEMENIAIESGGHAYQQIALEYEEGHSSEIDCVLICTGGFFVIEVKSNKGVIVGGPEDDYWTAIKEYWQEDRKLKNPIKQNKGHINHLYRMGGHGFPHVESLVIFPFAELRTVESPIVHDLHSAMDYIRDCIALGKYKRETVERFNKQFLSIVNRYRVSHEKHLRNLSDKYSA